MTPDRRDRWESGSEFDFPDWSDAGPSDLPTWGDVPQFYGSGRHALSALLRYGMAASGWRRLWVPSYFCQEVNRAILSSGILVVAYPANPLQPLTEFPAGDRLQPHDVVLSLNFFGLQYRPLQVVGPTGTAVVVVEDHTHDPGSPGASLSTADWCFASLRKTLPIPDGAVLWSPRGHALPPSPALDSKHASASLQKLAGMVLKRLYLGGRPVRKDTFRALAIAGEDGIAADAVSAITPWSADLLACAAFATWRRRRGANYAVLSAALATTPCVRMLPPDPGAEAPFAALLVFDTQALRDAVRAYLLAAGVYPAIHWSLEQPAVAGIPPSDVDLSRRILTVHCDFRYSVSDLARIAETIVEGCRRALYRL